MSSISRYFKKLENPVVRRYLLFGVISLILVYYFNAIIINGGIEQGKVDWGIDMGYTMLFWGIIIILFVIFILYYPRTYIVREKTLSKIHQFLRTSFLLYPILALLFLHWISHDPNLDFYHQDTGILVIFDKATHFLTAFLITAVLIGALATRQTAKYYIIIAILIAVSFELAELVINYYLYDMGFTDSFSGPLNSLLSEIQDVIPDMVANLLGVAFGYAYIQNKVKQ